MVIITLLYILLAIFAFGVMIFIHELGHFVVARLGKVTIYEFAIGIGPTVSSWKSKKYDTKYLKKVKFISLFFIYLTPSPLMPVHCQQDIYKLL